MFSPELVLSTGLEGISQNRHRREHQNGNEALYESLQECDHSIIPGALPTVFIWGWNLPWFSIQAKAEGGNLPGSLFLKNMVFRG